MSVSSVEIGYMYPDEPLTPIILSTLSFVILRFFTEALANAKHRLSLLPLFYKLNENQLASEATDKNEEVIKMTLALMVAPEWHSHEQSFCAAKINVC